MRTLLVLRHANATHDDRLLADHDRPLDGRGLRDAPLVGRLLVERDLVPGRVLSSTAVRAATTARLAAEAGGFADRVEHRAELYEADARGYLHAVRRLGGGASRILLVGHNPAVEGVIRLLTGRTEPMPPASLARIGLDLASWQDLAPADSPTEDGGRLLGVWRPVDLR